MQCYLTKIIWVGCKSPLLLLSESRSCEHCLQTLQGALFPTNTNYYSYEKVVLTLFPHGNAYGLLLRIKVCGTG